MIGNEVGLSVVMRSYSKKGRHDCKNCYKSNGGYCNDKLIGGKWGFMVGKECKK